MSKTLDNLGVSAFCESMAMMVQSGITTDEAIRLLQSGGDADGGLLTGALAVMKDHADAGEGLSASMRASGIFPEYALQMVEAGEDSGRLEDTLFRLSRYYADQKTISEKLRGAVTYPAAMLVLIIAVLVIMLTMVLPAFTEVYDRLTGSMAASTFGYLRWAYGICWAALILMVVIAAGLVIGLWMWNHGKRGPVEKILRSNGLGRRLLESMGMFRFTSALGMFLASGEMQDEAMDRSIPMTDCAAVEEKLARARARMDDGNSIATAAYEVGLFEPVYGRMLLAGERSGNLDSVLGRLSDLLRENCGALVDRLVGIVDPLLSGILMVTVGLSLLSVMLPLIGMMNSIG